MITINDTALNDNQLIFVLRITLDSETLRYATREITLSSNTYSDSVLLRIDFTTLQSISKNISIYNGGGVGSLSSMEFSLSNYSGKYIENFYPTTSQDYLTARKVEVGFLWVGATTEAEITWLNTFYVNSVSVETNKITCFCIELSDIETIDLPYHKVQKDFDNGVSYFPNAPIDNYGVEIPIVYGAFKYGTLDSTYSSMKIFGYSCFSPCIRVSKSSTEYITCAHQVYETAEDATSGNEYIFKYIDGLQTYLAISASDAVSGSTTNSYIRHSQRMLTVRGSTLRAFIFIRLVEPSGYSDVETINSIDQSSTSYDELNAVAGGDNKLALRCIGSATTSEIGYLSPDEVDAKIHFIAGTDGGGDRDCTISCYNETLPTPAEDSAPTTDTITSTTPDYFSHNMGSHLSMKKDAILPWEIDEVCALDFFIENNQTTPGEKIYVYYAYLALYDIRVVQRGFTSVRVIRNEMGERNI